MDLNFLHPMTIAALSSVLGLIWLVRDVLKARRARQLAKTRREHDSLQSRGA